MYRALNLTMHARRLCASALLSLPIAFSGAALAGAPSNAPQVLLAITNSESMDGTTSGAIMVGSGKLPAGSVSLYGSSSPTTYPIPSGFVPPLDSGDSINAPYTVACGAFNCDNSPSRMNLAKTAIKGLLNDYGTTLNFGIYTYQTSGAAVYTTWVYYMSQPGGFTFTHVPSASTVPNPCFGYLTASATVAANCAALNAGLYAGLSINTHEYMVISQSGDDPQINDVLYANGFPSIFVSHGVRTPADPYTAYPLSLYRTNIAAYRSNYSLTTPSVGAWATYPTNAGYVPAAEHAMYVARGFGYGANQSATTGSVAVPMNTDPGTSTAFTNALAPETSSAGTSEIKSLAGQSAIAGLLKGAQSYLGSIPTIACQGQYVVLLTDGLPTLDLVGQNWPPLGTATANAYGLTATFNGDGTFNSSNSQAVADAVAAIAALKAAGIKTFVVGLGAGVDPSVNPIAAQLLQAMALAGGTSNYYAAGDSASLNAAFHAIANMIYSESAIAAPVAPQSVADGTGKQYVITTSPSPTAGHVKAYTVDASGTPGSSPLWDAGTMSTGDRGARLMSNLSTGAIASLSSIDTAAFALSATPCVPDVTRVVNYTIDPSLVVGGCTYLAGRQSGWNLGPFTTRNTSRYVGAPASGLLTQSYPSYASYAISQAGRSPMVMFTNSDGFLYAIDANTGALKWGWISRNLLPKLQYYTTFAGLELTNGGFTVVDVPSGGSWASYVVGSMQSGAQHYALKLDGSGTPTQVVYDNVVAGGTAPGDLSGPAGQAPLRQPPVVAYVGNNAYAIYVINKSGTTTYYATNVATGVTTSKVLPFVVSAPISLDPSSNQIFFGAQDGSVWMATVLTGNNATTDMAQLLKIGNTVNPAGGPAPGAVQYVGYAEYQGAPYVYAVNKSQITVFGVSSLGWAPLWASTPSGGYTSNGTVYTASATVKPLTSGALVSDMPLVVGSYIEVPVFVPSMGCGGGTGYYNFFDIRNGKFNSAQVKLIYEGAPVPQQFTIGAGPAFTSTFSLILTGISLNSGSAGSTSPNNPLLGSGSLSNAPHSWRQR